MTNNSIALIQKKQLALSVMELVFTGKSIKESCEIIGIDQRTFDHALAKFPDLQEAFLEKYRSRIASLAENLANSVEQNTSALIAQAEKLRMRMDAGLLEDDATKLLMQIDKHIQRTLEIILPASKQETSKPPEQGDDQKRASALLAEMRGAKLVEVSRTTETYRMRVGGTHGDTDDVVDVQATEV